MIEKNKENVFDFVANFFLTKYHLSIQSETYLLKSETM